MATKWLTNRHAAAAAVSAPNPRPASFPIIWLAVVSANMRLYSICVCESATVHLCDFRNNRD